MLYHKIFVQLCLYNRMAPLLTNEVYTMLQTKNLPNEGLRRRKRILCCWQYHFDILTAANILYMIFHKWTPHHLWSIGIVDIIHQCIYWWCPKKHWSLVMYRKNNSIYFLNIYIQQIFRKDHHYKSPMAPTWRLEPHKLWWRWGIGRSGCDPPACRISSPSNHSNPFIHGPPI